VKLASSQSMTTNMETTRLLDVPVPASRVGLGTWAMGGTQWGGADDNESVRTIHEALDRGINVIDTAPAYGFGHSEEVVGRAIAEIGDRRRIVLATKAGLEPYGNTVYRNSSRARILREIDESLARLRTDYIDLYQIHWPDPRTPYEETAEALLELKRAGKIRAIGVSNYSIEAMKEFSTVAPLATDQPPLNLFEREAQEVTLPWCVARGVGTLTYGALCRGLLTGTIDESTKFPGDDLRKLDPKFQSPRFAQYLKAVLVLGRYARLRYDKTLLAFAVRWVLDQPGVSIALWGARHPRELYPVDEIMGWKLDAEAFAYVDETIAHTVSDPIGPQFMAPPESAPEQQPAVHG
jgi:aryl-alcohol dehydrogenase-like predicted oxidoreductase